MGRSLNQSPWGTAEAVSMAMLHEEIMLTGDDRAFNSYLSAQFSVVKIHSAASTFVDLAS
jgi:hypothetical protein